MQKKDVGKQVCIRIRTTLIAALALLAIVPLSAQQLSLDMIRVAGGTFQMGSAEDGPIHTVTVSDFKMSRTKVTQAQYFAITGKNPSNYNDGADVSNRPVEQVSWYEAVSFCNLLSSKEGLTTAYTIAGTTVIINPTATGYRLPTEAEWEYVARGRAKPDGATYSSSNDIDCIAWYVNSSYYETQAIATKVANGLGLFDMSYDAWEWCWDWYGNYSATAQTNPMGSDSGKYRVVRGGSWNYLASCCAEAGRGGGMLLWGAYRISTSRDNDSPKYQYGGIGFRVVRP